MCDSSSLDICSFKLSVNDFKLKCVLLPQSPIVLRTLPGSLPSKIGMMIGAQMVTSTFKSSNEGMSPLQHDILVSHHGKSFSTQKVFHFSKADWDSLRTFYSSYPWHSGISNDPSSFASFITNGILLGMDLFIPSSYKPRKKNSPKWFNLQCAKL